VLGLVAPTIVAAILALAAPPQERARPHGGVQWWPAAVGAFLCEFALYNPPIDSQAWALHLGPWLWIGARMVLLAVVLRNALSHGRWSSACLIVAAGISLNTLVIAANGGYMPQSSEAAAVVWGAEVVHERQRDGRLHNTAPLNAETRLPWLADVIVQPEWLPRRNVISIGDVLLSVGLAGWTFQQLRRSPRSRVTKAI
jgi:hypothetical protein